MISHICSNIVSVSNGMSLNYLYESAKDVLKYENLKVMEHIKDVMYIGVLVYMEDENFNKARNQSKSKAMTGDDLNKLALRG